MRWLDKYQTSRKLCVLQFGGEEKNYVVKKLQINDTMQGRLKIAKG